MDVDLADDGRILRVAVTSSPDARLTWAALGALTNFELLPAREVFADGTERAIAIRFSYTLQFTIDEVARERALAEDEARALIASGASTTVPAPVNVVGRIQIKAEPGTVSAADISVERDGVATDIVAVSDDDGVFRLRGVPAGRVVLVIDAAGFEEGRVVLADKQAGVVDEVVVHLERRATSGGEYVVSERRTQQEVTKRVLTHHELTRVPGTFGDAIRVVQRLPGVSRAPFGLGAVLVRGGSPEDSAIMIDGHVTRYLFHLGAGPSVLNSDFVERLEFYPGGQGARYGRAIAGAIDVVTKDPASDVWSGRATVDLLATSFKLEGPLTTDGSLSLFAAGRTSYIAEVLNAGDVLTRLVADENINVLTLAPRYADYQAKLMWKAPALPGLRQNLSLTILGAHDTLDLALDPSQLGAAAPSDVGLVQGFHRINPVYRARSTTTNDAGEPVLSVWLSPTVERNTSENRFDVSQFKLDVDRAGVRAEVALRPVGGVAVTLGTDDVWQHFV
ncbi:MAG TPA: TonB-dependent receptor, partial [Myxococcota bacterium]